VRGDGLAGNYRWGPGRKQALLAHEAQAAAAPDARDAQTPDEA
jgi:hypothetical protein